MPAPHAQRHTPNRETFLAMAEGVDQVEDEGDRTVLVPVFRRLTADALTPVAAYQKLRWGGRGFLFESVVGGEKIGRYSFVGADPFLTIEARPIGEGRHEVTLRGSDGEGGTSVQTFERKDPLAQLESLLAEYRILTPPGLRPGALPAFRGGAVGYAGYDTVRYVERLPNAPKDDRGLPDMQFGLYDRLVVFDHISKTILVVAHAEASAADPAASYDAACRKVDEAVRQLQQGTVDLPITDIDPVAAAPGPAPESNMTREAFEEAVRQGKEYIAAGDVFQFVPSQRFRRETHARPLDIYRALRVVNPSPFMFLLDGPDCTLIGASPEIMVRVETAPDATPEDHKRDVTIRPLAGTRRRGTTPAEDDALAAELLADPKERAEHVMLIDLARNDVGRVSRFGSVRLTDVMEVERYSHVMHLTSNVTGTLKPGLTALDALRSGLPAGTVSGAPKVRAMEIIDELEPHRRGPYGGAVGYVDFGGDMDVCIALRTMVMIGQTVDVQAGCGVVADSDPSLEYEETVHKARALLRAIDVAEGQL
ncbi:anthranilate synthase component I [Alienimonas californiensis]|uniref:Anthranilate synthase component 1 n=1 Tax=Alienimonas californiensis TaxID=2527989 RepID=A0A517PBX6_9PLAN|nr:anthranilate synthase component I [Alienimonas californiensis]QDT16878.1 Anthranilate synthase component 1 [Alienimonas californiensis]